MLCHQPRMILELEDIKYQEMYKDLQEYLRTKISVPLPSKRCHCSTGEMAETHDESSCFRVMHIDVEKRKKVMSTYFLKGFCVECFKVKSLKICYCFDFANLIYRRDLSLISFSYTRGIYKRYTFF